MATEKATKPSVFITDLVKESASKIQYPVFACEENTGELAIVAVVTATGTKIDFWIDVVDALRINRSDVLPNDWITAFGRCSRMKNGFNVRGSAKGWTSAIMKAGLLRYHVWYRADPLCMVGVFDDTNAELFWKRFAELYPLERMSDFDEQTRADIAARCIKCTHFWPPRETNGYTQLMFEVDALTNNLVLARAYLKGVTGAQIRSIQTSVKTHDYLRDFDNWKLANE